MTRTPSSFHHLAEYDLSPAATLRMLRSVAYREWFVYRAPAGTPEGLEPYEVAGASDELADSVDSVSFVEESEESVEWEEMLTAAALDTEDDLVATAPAPTIDLREAAANWYLNEVPADWIEDPRPEEESSAPISA